MKYFTPQSGFTLVETLVAITILLIVISGPLAISSSTAKSSSFSSEQVTAFFLAQEGLELAEKARDDLLLQYPTRLTPWKDFTNTTNTGKYRFCFADTNVGRSGCDFTISSNAVGGLNLTTCTTNGTECLFYLAPTTASRAHYVHSASPSLSWILQPFTRVVTFELVNTDELKVTSKVTWRTGALRQQQQVVVESRLFNTYGY